MYILGREFKNVEFQRLCSENDIKLFHAETFKAAFIGKIQKLY